MTERPAARALRVTVRTFGELCITVGLLLVLFVVWQLWWTDVAAGHAQQQITSQLQQTWQHDRPDPAPTAPVTEDPPLQLTAGTAFALLHVPRFGTSSVRPILQGVDLDILDHGIGHYPGTADPGAIGNFSLAGHRVTYAKPFNEIAKLRAGDPVVVETATTWFVYRVTGHQVVTPDHVEVIAPVPDEPGQEPTRRMLTLTACHPMYSARERYIVHAELSERLSKADGGRPSVLSGS